MTEHITVSATIALLWAELQTARSAAAQWKAREKELKEDILAFLGYDPDDPKPAPVIAVAPSGVPLFEVRVSTRKGLDINYLKKTHPDIYAEAEKMTAVKTLREADGQAEAGDT